MLHHGEAGWRAPTRFEALFDLSPEAAEFTPDFRFVLDLDLLGRRFGELPERVRERVLARDDAELVRWGARLFETGSLDDIFAVP